MEKLEYKDYFGSIEYSKEDNCLFGKVLGMSNNLISYEGSTAAELYSDFCGAIDDYLDYCHRNSIKPKKSYNGVLNIRIPQNTHSKLALIAERRGVSINSVVRHSLERELELA